MHILLAPDKFKSTLTAPEAARAIATGLRKHFPDATIIEQPLADGGEGTLDVYARLLPAAQRHRLYVTGPLRKPVRAEYLLHEGVAFIEMAAAAGLRHVPAPRRSPRNTTTIGVGQLIDDAVARGATHVNLFLGGSATNDGGAGMAAALGYRFFSDHPKDFIPMAGELRYVRRIDAAEVPDRLREITFTAVCDVRNPLLGPDGATYVYAEQKGEPPQGLPELETNMAHYADLLSATFGHDFGDLPGGGAAGGLGAGAAAFLNADLRPGIDVLLDAVGFDAICQGVDLVITGEGKIDAQTAHGKVVSGVARRAKAAGVPKVIAVCGRNELTRAEYRALGLDVVHALLDRSSMTLAYAMYRPEAALSGMVEELCSEW